MPHGLTERGGSPRRSWGELSVGGGPESAAYLDANIVIRLLIGDGGDHAPRARALLASGTRLHLTGVVAAEIVHVLRSVYGQPREEVAEMLREVLALANVATDPDEALAETIDFYATRGIDFVDANLAARAERSGRPIASFDADFDRIPTITRLTP